MRELAHSSDLIKSHALRAELVGSDTCSARSVIVQSSAPVLVMCRQLLAQGLSPDAALAVYRGATLALRIRSIGEAARLEVNSAGTGFAPFRPLRAASPVRQNGSAVTWVGVGE